MLALVGVQVHFMPPGIPDVGKGRVVVTKTLSEGGVWTEEGL